MIRQDPRILASSSIARACSAAPAVRPLAQRCLIGCGLHASNTMLPDRASGPRTNGTPTRPPTRGWPMRGGKVRRGQHHVYLLWNYGASFAIVWSCRALTPSLVSLAGGKGCDLELGSPGAGSRRSPGHGSFQRVGNLQPNKRFSASLARSALPLRPNLQDHAPRFVEAPQRRASMRPLPSYWSPAVRMSCETRRTAGPTSFSIIAQIVSMLLG